MRVSPLEKTNDPRESKHWLCHLTAPMETVFQEDFYLKTNDELNERLKQQSRMASFSIDDPGLPKDHNNRNGYSYSRMWAQYAGNQTGVCILFDRVELIDSFCRELGVNGVVWPGTVSYDIDSIEEWAKDAPRIQYSGPGTVDEFIKANYLSLLFRKRIDWRDEHEFRIMAYSSSLPGDYLYFSIAEALCGIVVGADFPESSIPLLVKHCERYKISADHLQWVAGIPFLSHPVYDYEYETQASRHSQR